MTMDSAGEGAAVKISSYLPLFFVDTDFLHNGKMLMLSKAQRHDFFGVLSLKRAGWLDKPYPCMQALDSLVAKMLSLGQKTCQKLKKKLMDLAMITQDWQPLGWSAWQSAAGHKRYNHKLAARDIIQAHQAQDERKEKAAQANRERVQRFRQKQHQATPEQQHADTITSITPTITGITPTITGITPTITGPITWTQKEIFGYEKNQVKSTTYSHVMPVMPLHIHRHVQEQVQEHPGSEIPEKDRGSLIVDRGVQGGNFAASPSEPPAPSPSAARPSDLPQPPSFPDCSVPSVEVDEQIPPVQQAAQSELEQQSMKNDAPMDCENVQEGPLNALQGPVNDELVSGQGLTQKTQPAALKTPTALFPSGQQLAPVARAVGSTFPPLEGCDEWMPKSLDVAAPVKKVSISTQSARLSDDWVLPKTWGDWALQERPDFDVEDVRCEAENFADYWRGKAGKDACKRDWFATWRNWIRKEFCKGKIHRTANGNRPKKPTPPPLTFREMDELNELRLSAKIHGKSNPRLDDLERRFAAQKNPVADVIDVDSSFQQEAVFVKEVPYVFAE